MPVSSSRSSSSTRPWTSQTVRSSSGGWAAASASCSSRMSPKSSSSRSSSVTMPAVPPYSSTATASVAPPWRKSKRRSLAGFDSGTTRTGAMMASRSSGRVEEVVRQHHADDLVDVLAVDRQAAEAGFDEAVVGRRRSVAPSSTAWISVRGTIESLTRSVRSSNTLDRISRLLLVQVDRARLAALADARSRSRAAGTAGPCRLGAESADDERAGSSPRA